MTIPAKESELLFFYDRELLIDGIAAPAADVHEITPSLQASHANRVLERPRRGPTPARGLDVLEYRQHDDHIALNLNGWVVAELSALVGKKAAQLRGHRLTLGVHFFHDDRAYERV